MNAIAGVRALSYAPLMALTTPKVSPRASKALRSFYRFVQELGPYLHLIALVLGLVALFVEFARQAAEAGAKFAKDKTGAAVDDDGEAEGGETDNRTDAEAA